MDQNYGDDYITITDEDGVEYELEVLSRIEYQGCEYLALAPADLNEESDDVEVSILKSVEENGESILVTVQDEEELEAVYDLLMDQMYEEESPEEAE